MNEKLTQEERQIIERAHKRFRELPEEQRKGMSFQDLEEFFEKVESGAYEAHSEFVEHYKNVKKLSIERLKKKHPNGATISEADFLEVNSWSDGSDLYYKDDINPSRETLDNISRYHLNNKGE